LSSTLQSIPGRFILNLHDAEANPFGYLWDWWDYGVAEGLEPDSVSAFVQFGLLRPLAALLGVI